MEEFFAEQSGKAERYDELGEFVRTGLSYLLTLDVGIKTGVRGIGRYRASDLD